MFVQVGDGTLGWPDAAPFDAIIVAAGGPEVPAALMQQLAIGGRLIIPVGAVEYQSLLKVRRVTEALYDTEELAPVRFVPLVGAQGWTEDGRRAATNHLPAREQGEADGPIPFRLGFSASPESHAAVGSVVPRRVDPAARGCRAAGGFPVARTEARPAAAAKAAARQVAGLRSAFRRGVA